jgi:HSP20 family protein
VESTSFSQAHCAAPEIELDQCRATGMNLELGCFSVTLETPMSDIPVEVKKAPQTATAVPETWHSFRSDMDRLFDRFARGFGLPPLRRIADLEPPWRSFIFSAPPIDMSEDDKA